MRINRSDSNRYRYLASIVFKEYEGVTLNEMFFALIVLNVKYTNVNIFIKSLH